MPTLISQPMDNAQIGVMGKYLREDSRSYEEALFGRAIHIVPDATAIVTQDVKFADVSFYQGVINWDIYRTQSIAVIIRAGQNLWIDPQFQRNWAEAKRVGLKRGVYYFYDDRVSPQQQADILIGLIKNDLPEMEAVIDWENTYGGSYGGLPNVVAFLMRVRAALPSVKLAVYTGYYWFKDHSNPTANAAEYSLILNQGVALWEAWYTSNPAYVLIPAPWSSLTHWQFGTPAVGAQWGAGSVEIDMNWFGGTRAEFDARYGGESPITRPDELISSEVLSNGLILENWVAHFDRGDINYHLAWADLSKVKRFFVTPYQSHKDYVTQFVVENSMSFGINGTGWVQDPQTQIITVAGPAVSNGAPYPPDRVGDEATLYIHPDKTFGFSRPVFPWPGGNAISFPNKLITNEQKIPINKAVDDIDPRMAYFYTDTHFIFMGVDGEETYGPGRTGMSFFEVQDRMFSRHAKEGFMDDGGGSGTMVYFDGTWPRIVNVPCGEDLVGGYRLRQVAQALCIEMFDDTTPPPPTGGSMQFQVITPHRPRSKPTISTSDTAPNVPAGTKFTSDAAHIQRDEITATHPMMVQVLDGPWAGKWLIDGWYNGSEMCRDITPAATVWFEFYIMEDPNGNRMGYRKDETIPT